LEIRNAKNVTTTNVTQDVIGNIPHGRSFQSVIQFAPAARNEPLMGNTTQGGYPGNGTGGSAPGGFSVAGGSDSENSYLVEGQETANLIGGYSRTTVPFDFIEEVEIKNSRIQAEHGGALGGVVNVIQKKGSNNYHGSIFSYFENDAMDAHASTFSRYDPNSSSVLAGPAGAPWGLTDPNFQEYVPKKDKTADIFPGFTFGGPIWKDHIFGFVGFNPEFTTDERTIIYPVGGVVPAGVRSHSAKIPRRITPTLVSTQQRPRGFAYMLPGSTNFRGRAAKTFRFRTPRTCRLPPQ
jgi:hypothetical protein